MLKKDSDILVSFSGGKTSAYMTLLVLQDNPKAKIVFANTGQEHPETIKFIKNCQDYFGWDIVFLEAKVSAGRIGTKYNVVKEPSMNGEPFEQVIIKYGIPNKGYPHCTRELKIQPIHAWAKDNLSTDYRTAIGIRADEMDRVPHDYKEKRYTYPLLNLGITKQDVNDFWDKQPFTLNIPERLGNCVTCWKKSDKKLLENMSENPAYFDFFERMESQYPNNGAGSGNRKFFRNHRSVLDLKELLKKKQEVSDETNGCEESCEVF